VALLATATLSPNTSIMTRAIHFFLGIESVMDEDKEREENDEWEGVNDIDFHQHSRKTKKRQNQVLKQIANRKKAQMRREKKKMEDGMEENTPNLYPAIEQLNNPQGLAEKLLKKIKNSASNAYKFDQKLTILNFVTRLVGVHELLVLPLYPFLTRYLGGHQKNVTNILAYVVQACHSLVPPDDVKGLLKTIAHNFITERCSEEQMAVGINAVTAICKRVPSLLGEDDDHDDDGGGAVVDMEAFVRDVARFSRHRDKSVNVAARGFVNFVRVTHPKLLQGKHRGLVGAAGVKEGIKPMKYGENRAAVGVEGAELLLEYEKKKGMKKKGKKDDEEEGDWEEVEEDEEAEESESDENEGDWKEVGEKEEEEGEGENEEDDEEGAEGDWEEVGEGEEDEEEEEEGEWEELEEKKEEKKKFKNKPKISRKERKEIRRARKLGIPLEDDSEGDEAPTLVETDEKKKAMKVRQEVSSTRIFSSEDFEKMRKLAAREKAIARDPRLMARKKRQEAKAKGEQGEDDSEEDSDESDFDDYSDYSEGEDDIGSKHIIGARDIMALSKKKKLSKIERLESIKQGRDEFESRRRAGGTTNTEKLRKKNFVMQSKSWGKVRSTANEKQTRFNGAGQRGAKRQMGKMEKAGKRRRK